jgi:transposase
MKNLSPKQKAFITLAALRGEKISQLCSTYQLHPNQIGKWKKQAEEEMEKIFTDKRKKENHSQERTIEELYKIIGQREVEISWLKKKFKLELPGEIDISE